jgi:hypothetical protein
MATEIIEDHDNNDQDSIAKREDVERSSEDVLGLNIQLNVSLQYGLVVLKVKELIDDEEHCPVCPVGVDQDGEEAKAVDSSAVSGKKGGEEKHQDGLPACNTWPAVDCLVPENIMNLNLPDFHHSSYSHSSFPPT